MIVSRCLPLTSAEKTLQERKRFLLPAFPHRQKPQINTVDLWKQINQLDGVCVPLRFEGDSQSGPIFVFDSVVRCCDEMILI